MRFIILILLLLSLLFFTGCKSKYKEFKVKSPDGYETKITEDKFEVKSKDWSKVEITESWLNLDINDEEIWEIEDVVKEILK